MARTQTFVLTISAAVAALVALAFAATQLNLFAPTSASGSPAEVVGGSIHVLSASDLTWNEVNGNPLQYSLTVSNKYQLDTVSTSGVRGVKGPISLHGAWKVELTSPKYSQAVTICSESDPKCPLTSQTTDQPIHQIYANLSSANLFWELASGTQLRFHDRACDNPSAKKENRTCDFLSNVTISDSTHPSLASGECSRWIIFKGRCNIYIGK
jgi:hypothetical protein